MDEIPAILDSLDAVPETMRPLFAEIPDGNFKGKFMPKIKGRDGFELRDVGGLTRTIENERRIRKDAEAKLARLGDLDPDQARAALERLEKLKDALPADQLKSHVEQALSSHQKASQKEIEARDKQIARLTKLVNDSLIDARAAMAIEKAGGHRALLMPHIKSAAALEGLDGDGDVVTVLRGEKNEILYSAKDRVNTVPMGLDEYVETLRERFPQAFSGGGASGSGASGGGGDGARGGKVRVRESELPARISELREAAAKAGKSVTDYVEVVPD